MSTEILYRILDVKLPEGFDLTIRREQQAKYSKIVIRLDHTDVDSGLIYSAENALAPDLIRADKAADFQSIINYLVMKIDERLTEDRKSRL